MATRAAKAQIVSDLATRLKEAPLSIVAGFTGLGVGQMQDLRRRMRDAGATFRVVKITLARLAAHDAGLDDLHPHLQGQSSLTFSGEDVAAAARALRGFAVESSGVEVRAGVLEGEIIAADRVDRIAALTGMDQLYAELVWSIESPISGLVHTLDGLVPSLVYALQGRLEQLEART